LKKVAVIGAGIVGLACAAELQRRGHDVTLIDPLPPGEGCSFGNAGCLSRASCVPLGLPGAWRKVPGWLLDPSGPLSIPPRYLLRIAPWLWRFQRSTSLARVNQIADALHPLLDKSIEKWRPLAAWAGVPELIRQDGYAFTYESEAGFLGDALGRSRCSPARRFASWIRRSRPRSRISSSCPNKVTCPTRSGSRVRWRIG
jgi:D-amino-acid dehydrogenase